MTKKLTPHQNCPVCSYWIGQIREYRARALKGAERAFRSERIARRELTDHLARTHQPAVTSLSRRVTR